MSQLPPLAPSLAGSAAALPPAPLPITIRSYSNVCFATGVLLIMSIDDVRINNLRQGGRCVGVSRRFVVGRYWLPQDGFGATG